MIARLASRNSVRVAKYSSGSSKKAVCELFWNTLTPLRQFVVQSAHNQRRLRRRGKSAIRFQLLMLPAKQNSFGPWIAV